MKLYSPDWKTAWFENHISDRFFQEMAKLEKGTALTLESSAQWMNQVMIETGMLAQNMNALEEKNAGPNQIRVAADKAMRLAALAVHLMTTLDGAHRGMTGQADPLAAGPRHGLAIPARAPAGQPPQEQPAPEPAPAAQPAAASQANHPPQMRGGGLPANIAGMFARMEADATSDEGAQSTPASGFEPGAEPDDAILISPFQNMEGQNAADEGSPMRNTIISLNSRGLSIAEFEVITEQPRHIVEAVLEHHKRTSRPNGQATA